MQEFCALDSPVSHSYAVPMSSSVPLGYTPLHGLPPLAGICSFAEAQRPGLSVEACVRRIKRWHYALRRLHEIFIARLTAEHIYELKMAFSLHAHLCAEHASALRSRVAEMREPPLGLDVVPDENLSIFFDEILHAPSTAELLFGLYEAALPALLDSLERHPLETNPLADHPTVRLCRLAALELREATEYGQKAVAVLVSTEKQNTLAAWSTTLQGFLAAAGHLDGSATAAPTAPACLYSAEPRTYDKTPRRDERFPDPYNMGVNAEAFLYEPSLPPEPKVLMIFYKRLREIDVPEMMASIIHETEGKPWGFYRDMTRQLWDEARHAMMGEVGFLSLGIDWPQFVRVNFTWSLGLNTQLTARERHGVLYYIEQGLMPKTGKRYEWETAVAAHNQISAVFQDFDWADEVLHARIGRDWYVNTFDNPKEAVEWGDRCWSKVVLGWRQWRDEGFTSHENWWPGLYREHCRLQGITPDPAVLDFSTSYETQRADLKILQVSA